MAHTAKKFLLTLILSALVLFVGTRQAQAYRCYHADMSGHCTQYRPDVPYGNSGGTPNNFDCKTDFNGNYLNPAVDQVNLYSEYNMTGFCVTIVAHPDFSRVSLGEWGWAGGAGQVSNVRSIRVGGGSTGVQFWSDGNWTGTTSKFGPGYGNLSAPLPHSMAMPAPVAGKTQHCTGNPVGSQLNIYSEPNQTGWCITVLPNVWVDSSVIGWVLGTGSANKPFQVQSFKTGTTPFYNWWMFYTYNFTGDLYQYPANSVVNVGSADWGYFPRSLATPP